MTQQLTEAMLDDLLQACKAIAVDAAAAILRVAERGGEAWDKQDGSPVTEADLQSNAVICRELAKLPPHFPVVSEENDSSHLAIGKGAYWLVDPLDGTKEFVKGLPEYTVNIALIAECVPVLGVILIPPSGVLYSARRGGGARRETATAAPRQMEARHDGGLAEITAVVSRSHCSAATSEYLKKIGATKIVQRGSSLKMCAVAEGVADIYPRLGPTWYWDTGAGAVICREAGCRVIDHLGKSLDYGPAESLKHHGFIIHAPVLENVVKQLLQVS